jgi:hypothetical protein
MNNFKKKKPLFILMILAIIFVLPVVVMLLWNAILPDVIGVNTITYWQAVGIFILSKILFGGFKSGGRPSKGGFGRNKFKEKFMNMDDEQKSKFKEEWKKRCETE